jgi:hypothetical protein
MMPPMGTSCDGGTPGGMMMGGAPNFCKEMVTTPFFGCLQSKCSGACVLPGAPPAMCGPLDAGQFPSADAGLPDAGSGCGACLETMCAEETKQCKLDM